MALLPQPPQQPWRRRRSTRYALSLKYTTSTDALNSRQTNAPTQVGSEKRLSRYRSLHAAKSVRYSQNTQQQQTDTHNDAIKANKRSASHRHGTYHTRATTRKSPRLTSHGGVQPQEPAKPAADKKPSLFARTFSKKFKVSGNGNRRKQQHLGRVSFPLFLTVFLEVIFHFFHFFPLEGYELSISFALLMPHLSSCTSPIAVRISVWRTHPHLCFCRSRSARLPRVRRRPKVPSTSRTSSAQRRPPVCQKGPLRRLWMWLLPLRLLVVRVSVHQLLDRNRRTVSFVGACVGCVALSCSLVFVLVVLL
jgi:hypothetical protein